MRRMAKTHRPARNHHIHRNARLGSRRSAIMTLGITAPACCCRASARASSRSHRSSLRGAFRRSISRCFTSSGSRGGRTRRCWPRCASSRRRLSKRREASRPGSSTTRGFKKKGSHSVGVARQYCGRPGKTDNCQIAVTLSIANHAASLPIAYRLYLPEDWAGDEARRKKVRVPDDVVFKTKPGIALDQIKAALAAGVAPGVLLADAGYGVDGGFRSGVTASGLTYVVGVQSTLSVWRPDTEPLPPKPWSGQGRPPSRIRRDGEHAPISV